jgi:hypothetical protein
MRRCIRLLIPVQPLCGFRLENKVWGVAAEEVRIVHFPAENPVPPSPLPTSGIITLARNSPQNTDVKELRY